MRMGNGMIQQQTTKLVMTTKLHQGIHILQFSVFELLEYINQQLSENPVIEQIDLEVARLQYDSGFQNRNSLVIKIIDSYLEDLAQYKFQKITADLGVASREVQEAMNIIKQLNPRPGASFSMEQSRYIIPDVIIDKVGNQYVISVNDAAAPRLSNG